MASMKLHERVPACSVHLILDMLLFFIKITIQTVVVRMLSQTLAGPCDRRRVLMTPR